MPWHPRPTDLLRLAKEEPPKHATREEISIHLSDCEKCKEILDGLVAHFENRNNVQANQTRWKI